MKRYAFLVVGLVTLLLFANPAPAGVGSRSAEGLWTAVSEATPPDVDSKELPVAYRTFKLDESVFRDLLRAAPEEFTSAAELTPAEVSLPMPDGSFARFRIEGSSIMAPGLAAKYREIKSYRVRGIDDPSAHGRVGMTRIGFHGLIRTEKGTVRFDRLPGDGPARTIVFYEQDDAVPRGTCENHGDSTGGAGHVEFTQGQEDLTPPSPQDFTLALKKFGVAIATTQQWCSGAGGPTNVVDRVAAIMDGAAAMFEVHLGYALELVDGTDALFFCSEPDPYDNGGDCYSVYDQNQTTMDSAVAAGTMDEYDIGHVFAYLSGGYSGCGEVPSVCDDAKKAWGLSRFPATVWRGTRTVGHEMGHQFGGTHTENGDQSWCALGHYVNHSVEPGSGSTIMSYAGICADHNIQQDPDTYFHYHSVGQIRSYIFGESCYDFVQTDNHAPQVTADAGDFAVTIPRSTPFVLSATWSDPDGDQLTFTWEQNDPATNPSAPDEATVDGPLFRSYPPSTNGHSRTFPPLSDLLGGPPTLGELLPPMDRSMTFVISAYDGRGGKRNDIVHIDVEGEPFEVTAPTEPVFTGLNLVTWNETGAEQAGATLVDIYLSMDTGQTWDLVLPNADISTGEAVVDMQTMDTVYAARIKLVAVDGIFFTISDPFMIVANECPNVIPCATACMPTNCHTSGTGSSVCWGDDGLETCRPDTIAITTCDCVDPTPSIGGARIIDLELGCPGGQSQSWGCY